MASNEVAGVFADYGLEACQSAEISALVEMCEKSGMDAESLGDKWMQWKLNKRINSEVVTGDLISRFGREAKLMIIKRKPVVS
mgnify:CR=1 FL=1